MVLSAESIHIMPSGSLTVGTPEAPFTGNASIVLTGSRFDAPLQMATEHRQVTKVSGDNPRTLTTRVTAPITCAMTSCCSPSFQVWEGACLGSRRVISVSVCVGCRDNPWLRMTGASSRGKPEPSRSLQADNLDEPSCNS